MLAVGTCVTSDRLNEQTAFHKRTNYALYKITCDCHVHSVPFLIIDREQNAATAAAAAGATPPPANMIIGTADNCVDTATKLLTSSCSLV